MGYGENSWRRERRSEVQKDKGRMKSGIRKREEGREKRMGMSVAVWMGRYGEERLHELCEKRKWERVGNRGRRGSRIGDSGGMEV